MDKLLFILLGVIIWQAITFITFAISDADESITAYIGCGFVGLLSMFLMRSIYYFGKSIQNKMFKIKGRYDKKNTKL